MRICFIHLLQLFEKSGFFAHPLWYVAIVLITWHTLCCRYAVSYCTVLLLLLNNKYSFYLLRKHVKVGARSPSHAKFGRLEAPQNVLQCCGNEEVLLLQAQLFAFKELLHKMVHTADSANHVIMHHDMRFGCAIPRLCYPRVCNSRRDSTPFGSKPHSHGIPRTMRMGFGPKWLTGLKYNTPKTMHARNPSPNCNPNPDCNPNPNPGNNGPWEWRTLGMVSRHPISSINKLDLIAMLILEQVKQRNQTFTAAYTNALVTITKRKLFDTSFLPSFMQSTDFRPFVVNNRDVASVLTPRSVSRLSRGAVVPWLGLA